MFASLKYEQLPHFCDHCGIIGHSLDTHRAVKDGKNENKHTEKVPTKHPKHKSAEREQVRKGVTNLTAQVNELEQELASKNGFAILAEMEEGLHKQVGQHTSPSNAYEEQMLDTQPEEPLLVVGSGTRRGAGCEEY